MMINVVVEHLAYLGPPQLRKLKCTSPQQPAVVYSLYYTLLCAYLVQYIAYVTPPDIALQFITETEALAS